MIQQVEGAGALKSGPIAVNFTAGAKPQTNVINLGLRVDYQLNDKVNIGVGAFYKVPEAEKGHQGYFDYRPQYGGMLTLTIPFGGGRKNSAPSIDLSSSGPERGRRDPRTQANEARRAIRAKKAIPARRENRANAARTAGKARQALPASMG